MCNQIGLRHAGNLLTHGIGYILLVCITYHVLQRIAYCGYPQLC